MYNNRPVEDPKLQEALEIIQTIMMEYDLTGCVQLGNANEWTYTYRITAEWNAAYYDDSTPLGIRMRAKHDVPGDHQKLEALAGVFGAMKDFGAQNIRVAQDFILMLKDAGIEVDHTPFGGGEPPPQVIDLNAHRFEQGMQGQQPLTRSERRRRQRQRQKGKQ